MKKSYLGVWWNTDDLISCKQAVAILYFDMGVPEEEINTLDFDELDVQDVLDELF